MLVGITLLTFLLSHAVPADPVTAYLGPQASGDPQVIAAFRHRWGLDRPLPEQYGIYLWNLARGDMGVSISTRQPVMVDLKQHLPATIELATAAMLVSLLVSIPLEVLGEEYVRTARAKGLATWAVVVRHAARNSLIPVVTVIGLSFGGLLSGAVVTETVFAWPGLGSYAFHSATALDFPAIMGVGLVVATIYILVNLVVDIAYAFVDPRIRVG